MRALARASDGGTGSPPALACGMGILPVSLRGVAGVRKAADPKTGSSLPGSLPARTCHSRSAVYSRRQHRTRTPKAGSGYACSEHQKSRPEQKQRGGLRCEIEAPRNRVAAEVSKPVSRRSKFKRSACRIVRSNHLCVETGSEPEGLAEGKRNNVNDLQRGWEAIVDVCGREAGLRNETV